jgi:hypothetical protein
VVTDHVTQFKLLDGRMATRTVTVHNYKGQGESLTADWSYTSRNGTRRQLLIDNEFEPGSRSKLASWTTNGVYNTTNCKISKEGKVVSWSRSARRGSGPIREIGQYRNGIRYSEYLKSC